MGDLRAQIAANNTGVYRVVELVEKYSAETLYAAMCEIMDYSERRMRAAIVEMPRGEYEASDYMEDVPGIDDLTSFGAGVVTSRVPHTLLDGMVGVAYRPIGKESLYLLSYIKYLMDKKGSTPSGNSTTNLITSTEINYRISPRLTIMAKYAGKFSWENTGEKRFLAYTDMLMGGATAQVRVRRR